MTMLPTRLRVSMGRAFRSRGAEKNKTLAFPLIAVIVVIVALAARAAETEAARTMYVTLVFFGVMFVVMTLVTMRWSQPKTVSVVLRGGVLVFSPPAVPLIVINLITGLAMLSIARLWTVPEQWTHLPFYARGMFVVGPVLGVFLIAEALWPLRRWAGLSMDQRGLRGVRGGPRVDLEWADVFDVRVIEAKERRLLVLVFAAGGDMALIPDSAVSGDVYAVATVVKYYLEHPEERSRLVDGLTAVRHVDAEVRAGRFARL